MRQIRTSYLLTFRDLKWKVACDRGFTVATLNLMLLKILDYVIHSFIRQKRAFSHQLEFEWFYRRGTFCVIRLYPTLDLLTWVELVLVDSELNRWSRLRKAYDTAYLMVDDEGFRNSYNFRLEKFNFLTITLLVVKLTSQEVLDFALKSLDLLASVVRGWWQIFRKSDGEGVR